MEKQTQAIELEFTEINSFNSHEVYETLTRLIEQNSGKQTSIDLSALRSIDTCGVQLLYALKVYGSRRGHQVELVNHPFHLIKLLDIYGLLGTFGDRIKLSRDGREQLDLSYSLKKRPRVGATS